MDKAIKPFWERNVMCKVVNHSAFPANRLAFRVKSAIVPEKRSVF